jgi:glyoxylase-like metal-dependent hydrolase (beta-lactamase superfamily II)
VGDALFTGDTIFADSYGRCDLYGGNYATLRRTIKNLREYSKDKNLTIYPGHGGAAKLKTALDIVEYL